MQHACEGGGREARRTASGDATQEAKQTNFRFRLLASKLAFCMEHETGNRHEQEDIEDNLLQSTNISY